MKIVFFGTPFFAAECLQYLLHHQITVAAIVTQPDRPKGRALKLLPSPVKQIAGQIPVFQPEKASDPKFLEEIAKIKADLFVVVAFGQILPQKLLDLPSLGSINVHASLLPKYRGAAPIQRALMNGEKETGIAIQKMVKQLDAGDVIAFKKTAILENMTFGELEAKLLELAKPLLLEVIQKYEKGVPLATPQNHEEASYAAKISLDEGEINWNLPAQKIHNLVRAFSPKPGAWCKLPNGNRLKVLRTQVASQNGAAGALIGPGPLIACGDGALLLLEVQPEGKKAMSGSDWRRGNCTINYLKGKTGYT